MQDHQYYLRKSLDIAKQSMDKGNLPFGCILIEPTGEVLLEGENTVVTDNDAIAHCEINLVHQLKGKFDMAFLQNCTVYASTEPCPMCAAAIFWSGIGRIVFALSKEGYHSVAQTSNPAHIMNSESRRDIKEWWEEGGNNWTFAGRGSKIVVCRLVEVKAILNTVALIQRTQAVILGT